VTFQHPGRTRRPSRSDRTIKQQESRKVDPSLSSPQVNRRGNDGKASDERGNGGKGPGHHDLCKTPASHCNTAVQKEIKQKKAPPPLWRRHEAAWHAFHSDNSNQSLQTNTLVCTTLILSSPILLHPPTPYP